MTGITVGRFAVRSRLGTGGMGEVYRADDLTLKRPVALKRIAPQLRADERYRRRFLSEAERASAINSQYVAAIYDVLEDGGDVFLVMEYVEGQTLRQRLDHPITIRECLELAVQSAAALVAAHGKAIVHRDIKPENIMLTPAGEVKILDFGVAKRLSNYDETKPTAWRDSGATGVSGTPGYIAPEVLLEQESDGRADIFSLGVVIYELLTGKHPFEGAGFVATSDRILHHDPPGVIELNPKAPAPLGHIVAKMLAKEPSERYATAADLLVDLRAVEQGLSAPGLALPRPVRTHPQSRRRPWALVWGLSATLLVIVLAVPLVRQELERRGLWNPLPRQKNVVVLPFRAVGGGAENQTFCDGLRETLTAQLTQLTGAHPLQVSSAAEVRARRVSTAEDARKEFSANLVLDGSVYASGQVLQVTYSLVDSATLRNRNARTITVPASDRFAVQDQIVESVAGWLDLRLKPEEYRLLATRGTQVAGAYDFYLQGRGYLQNYDKPENIDSAITVFQRALALDQQYALAKAGLGEAYWRKYETSKDGRWVESGRQACREALSLNSKLAAAHICLGTLENGTGKFEDAVAAFHRALESEPTNDDAYRGLASAYERLGKAAEAEKIYQRAIALRPQYWGGYSWLGGFYYNKARYAEAAKMFAQVVALAPDSFRGYFNLGGTYVQEKRYQEAIQALDRSIAIRPSPSAYNNLGNAYFGLRRYPEAATKFDEARKLDPAAYLYWGNLGFAYSRIPGKTAEATAAYRQAVALAQKSRAVNPRNSTLLGRLAVYHAKLGEREAALACVRDGLAIAPHDSGLLLRAASVYIEVGDADRALDLLQQALAAGLSVDAVHDVPDFDKLRGDPRFQKLVGPK